MLGFSGSWNIGMGGHFRARGGEAGWMSPLKQLHFHHRFQAAILSQLGLCLLTSLSASPIAYSVLNSSHGDPATNVP